MRRPSPARPPVRLRTLAVVAAVTVAVVVGGCSGDGSSSSAAPATDHSRPITQAEAAKLADVLVNNHDKGGADVVAEVTFGQATFTLTGAIDWTHHVGRVTVHSVVKGVAQRDFDVVFDQDVTFEQVPGLQAALAQQGRPGIDYVARPLDATTSTLHVVLQLLQTASSIQRDNPVLLMSKHVRFVRSTTVAGTKVDVYDYGRTTYWVGADGLAHRITAELASSSSTATLTFSAFGPKVIAVPGDTEIIGIDDIRPLYQQLMSGSSGQ